MTKEKKTELLNTSAVSTDRAVALKLAYEALSGKVFSNLREVDKRDVEELFELAEYNARFIAGKDIGIVSVKAKIDEMVRQANKRSRGEC
jgi:hypothetical protein